MIKLTALKMRRMSLGLRQIDVVLSTGIHQSKVRAIENELIQPTAREAELIDGFFNAMRKRATLMREALPDTERQAVPA